LSGEEIFGSDQKLEKQVTTRDRNELLVVVCLFPDGSEMGPNPGQKRRKGKTFHINMDETVKRKKRARGKLYGGEMGPRAKTPFGMIRRVSSVHGNEK